MDQIKSPHTRMVLLTLTAVVALYLLYFAGLGRNPLVDPDEPIYGQFVKEMVKTGDWLTPHNSLGLGFDKPPLFYWLSSICVKAAGLTEGAIRMPSAIFAVLILLGVYLLASYDFGKRAGVLAAAVMGTSLLQIIMSHAAATDEIMVGCMVAALYAYRRWIDSDYPKRLLWMAICGLATGLGMLAKGPVVPLLLLLTFIAHLVWTRQLVKLRSLDALLAILIFMIVGLPWYIAMWVMHGKAFVMQFIIGHNLARFVQPLHKSQASHWYSHFNNIGFLLLFLFPWNAFLLQSIRSQWKANTGAKLCICWLAIVLVFFSISKTQNFTYTLPVFPVCAILIGTFLSKIETSDALRRSAKIGIVIGCVFSLLLAIGLIITVSRKFPDAMQLAELTAIVLVLVFLAPAVGMLRHQDTEATGLRRAPWMMTAGMIAFSMLAINALLPQVSGFLSSKQVAQRILTLPKAQIVSYKLWRPGLLYYLNIKPNDLDNTEDVARLAAENKPTLFICKDKEKQFVEPYCPMKVYEYGNLVVYGNSSFMNAK
ncbi:MAG: glycosyltransferase family 39 protein [Armatimonadetes bacterium]|nr:glycosyltransferase family 39 protein [Armatimonadota bacterium]